MFDVFYLWVAAGITFLIVEMLTSTLYGLSLSIAGFLLAFYVSIAGVHDANIAQWFAFATISGAFCLIFPRMFNSYKKENVYKTGLDASIGATVVLGRVGEDFKVKIDGVDYLVDESCVTDTFAPKKRAKVVGHDAGKVKVELISGK